MSKADRFPPLKPQGPEPSPPILGVMLLMGAAFWMGVILGVMW